VDGGVEAHPKGNIGLSGFGLGDQFDAIDKLHARDHAGQ
jgi:hypothetical protein